MFIHCLTVSYDMRFEAEGQEFNYLENTVVVQELKFAINLALYGLCEAWVTNTSY